MIIDRLFKEVEKKGNVCVGLDSHLDHIPNHIKEKYQDIDEILFQFNKGIIDNTLDIVPVYKLQIAFYEAYGIEGLIGYKRTIEYIKSNGSIIIGDIKRGDIASTAEMYAKAHFEGDFQVDFITLNPYMGFDSITPYLKYIETGEKGMFVLLRTSNPGAKDIQYLNVNTQLERLYYHVGDSLNEIGSKYIGNCGYSSIGAVVGGTHRDEAEEIRNRYKNMFFLIPGYGHQGGKGEDVALYLKDGNGGIVNSSRGIITAYNKYEDGPENFDKYAREAVLAMKEDIKSEGRV
ncbi:orotidine-5'-phosphate decarboxylase [Clostridium sp. Cult3]|uniref:orotidine-5'-phosphate decarboxylase n=1 Tax=Clostridium sp. Cult3 TaxID=2079004 RepID=UPI001F00A978|nr:orotidine-5'-phosphate decarboxylase [Clostridium sp. Cult3]MCF6459878.1 orotidine-5'-phosphate decarboxylase [Clostridium sp. Cult3]